MSGTQIAERICCMRIDWPPKRVSSPALSDRIATLSLSAVRAIDCGTARALSPPRLSRAIFGRSSPSSSTSRIATRSTSRIWYA